MSKNQSDQPTTYAQFAERDTEPPPGRHGKDPRVRLTDLAASHPWQLHAMATGVEPPLGYRIDEVEPVGSPNEIQASLQPPSTAPSPDDGGGPVTRQGVAGPSLQPGKDSR
jgi:hypothetical protein